MVHLDNNIKGQKEYLFKCGYKKAYLNSISKKKLYGLYRKEESKKNPFFNKKKLTKSKFSNSRMDKTFFNKRR